MATSAQVLTKVKNRLDIPSATTTFDVVLADFIDSARARLFPRVSLEIDSQVITTFTQDDDEIVLDVTTGLTEDIHAARQIEIDAGYGWSRVNNFYHHGNELRIREVPTGTTQIRIYGISPFRTVEDVPEYFLQPLYWYAMAEFYDYLSGNNSQYTIYTQATGARGVDNMQEVSAYYDSKADRYLDENGQKYGN